MEKIKKFYNIHQYPKSNQYTSNQKRTNKKIIAKILRSANITEKDLFNKRILDIGCGTGEKSIYFAKNGAKEVVSVDFSLGQLNELEKKIKKEKLINIIIKEKDIIKDNLEDLKKFDLIFCLGVLHHTEDPYLGFKKICSLLKNDGIIVIGVYHKYSRIRYRIQRILLRTFVSKDPEKIIEFLLTSKLTKKFRKAPLSTLYDRYAVPYESYHTLREVKKWFLKNNIKIINYRNIRHKIEIFNLFEKKSIFFVGGKRFIKI